MHSGGSAMYRSNRKVKIAGYKRVLNEPGSSPSSESILYVSMADDDVGSLPDPMGETACQVKKKGNWMNQVANLREESLTKLDNELTPFKKVMNKKGMVSVKGIEQTPVLKGKGQVVVTCEDSVMESNNEPPLQTKAVVAPTKPI